MKKVIMAGIVFLCGLPFVLSCNISPVTRSANLSAASSSEEENPSPAETAEFNVLETGTVITAKELGLHSISNSDFYWSPDGDYVVFIGHLKDDNGKYTPNAYLLRLSDQNITKIADGTIDTNYYLSAPTWSEDGLLLAFQFCAQQNGDLSLYLYDIKEEKLKKLPVKGFGPSISPDKSKIAYFNENGDLSLFSLADQTNSVIPGNLKGFDVNWFSDGNRILFIKKTGKNPSGMEGAELEDFCILETAKNAEPHLLGIEQVYRSITWILEDEFVWVESGWDDGHQMGVLDLDSFNLTDFGESRGQYFQVNGKQARFLVYDDLKGEYRLLNRKTEKIGAYSVEKKDQTWAISALSLLPDGRLLYFDKNLSTNTCMFYLSFLNEGRFVQSKTYQGNYYPILYKDGSKIAVIPDRGAEMILIDPSKIKSP